MTSLIGDHGIYAVFLLMLIDAVLPAASELVMLYAGALAAGAFANQHVVLFGGRIHSHAAAFFAIVAAGTVGYLLGSLLGWVIGIYGGRPYLERHGRWLHLSPARLERAERWFERFGSWAVFLGRITPVVRSFVSIPAGVFRSPLGRYTLLTLAGSAIWCTSLAAAGWGFGNNYERFHSSFRYADYGAGMVVLALLALALGRRRRRSDGRPSAGAGAKAP